MFSGTWKEANEQKAELPEDSPIAFNLFLEYVYTGQIKHPKEANFVTNRVFFSERTQIALFR